MTRLRRWRRLFLEGFAVGWRARWPWVLGILIGVLALHLPPAG